MSSRQQGQEGDKVLDLLQRAKLLAKEYYQLTGRPLGVTGEIAEYEAVRLLGPISPRFGIPALTPCAVRVSALPVFKSRVAVSCPGQSQVSAWDASISPRTSTPSF